MTMHESILTGGLHHADAWELYLWVCLCCEMAGQ